MTVTEPTPDPQAAADPGAATDTPVDQAFLDLVDRIKPFIMDWIGEGAKAAIDATPVTTERPGVVLGVDNVARTAQVLVDGDTAAITAQVLTELPYVNARVMVKFVPPSAVFVGGVITDTGVPVGVMLPYAGTITAQATAAGSGPTAGTPPPGYLAAIGGNVSRSTYAALFAIIGTTYGSGDGSTTFGLPDMRGRAFFGLDTMAGSSDAGRLSAANVLGTTGGAESVTIATTNLPASGLSFTPSGTVSISSVTGSVSVSTNAHTLTGSGGVPNWDGGNGSLGYSFVPTAWSGASPSGSFSFSGASASFSGSGGTTSNMGSGTALTTMPPYLLGNWIIRA